jgi:hypothetical protein
VIYNDPGTSTYALDLITFKPTDEYDWYLATPHQTANNDGNISLLPASNITNGTPITIINGVNSLVVNVSATSRPSTVDITFDTSGTPPLTSDWVIYNEDNDSAPDPFYRVRFIGGSGWAGHGETGNVVDSNMSKRKNRRLGW